ncbi:Calcium-independent phospholipase A2-gamma [Strongyloides ratti]|uniref:Calcium-independent phospholipase A2-gamma n=1 Tax=Strongyloides ratti TaxID=34506 RepID=A0A090KZS8_STRRB|nr:Calcium-independent phospholipase A2-gamma [Strongyloides ratti]CEF60689.1 Calcium-independent phospholipase A2-gamma [Strongyloides ratti]
MLKNKQFLLLTKLKKKIESREIYNSKKLLISNEIKDDENNKKIELDKTIDVNQNQFSLNNVDKKENKIDIPKKKIDILQPSYFGYLSGVLTTVWDEFGKKIDENSILKYKVKKDVGTKNDEQNLSKTKISKILIKDIPKVKVINMTKMHVNELLLAQSTSSKLLRIQALISHIQEFRSSRMTAIKNHLLIPHLLDLVETGKDVQVQEEARKCLSILGYPPYLKSSGIRILSIDGGGTRGIIGLTVLEAIEKTAGKKIYELFDFISGVSTGAILAVLLGIKKISVDECRRNYVDLSRRLFTQQKLPGVSGLLTLHSFYNTSLWTEILKENVGDSMTCADSAKYKDIPKISIVSCILNSPQLQPFVFRNYELPVGHDSQFKGGNNFKIWQAVQASSAAPGYFEEVRLGSIVHQDGGILANNPTAIAIHEAKHLWPNEDIQCVVSIGTGRSVSEIEFLNCDQYLTKTYSKISKIIDSATDSQATHICVNDLLPGGMYYRLNPYMSFPYALDEIEDSKLEQMKRDAELYVRRNIKKIEDCSKQLIKKPTLTHIIKKKVTNKLNQMGIFQNNF